MQKITLICVGNLKDKEYISMCEEYKKRISRFAKINIIELKEKNNLENVDQIKQSESEEILAKIDINKTVLFDVASKEQTSEQFAEFLEKWFHSSSEITFVIGGSYGVSDEVKKKIGTKISFSCLTFPHQLMRVIFLEQLYRGFTINANKTYHK